MEAIETHAPVLQEFIRRTSGPVLELGMGHCSTPLLHDLCDGRLLVSVENNPDWFERFAHYGRGAAGKHHVALVKDWDEIPAGRWAVALVDQAPGEARSGSILALRDVADYIVVHDTEPGAAHLYPGVAEALATFPYRLDYRNETTYTTVVSMTRQP